MPAIPSFMLKKLYAKGSLANTEGGFKLSLRNTLAPGTIIAVNPLVVDGQEYPIDTITVSSGGRTSLAHEISAEGPFMFPVGSTATLEVSAEPLPAGEHSMVISVNTREVGALRIEASDTI